MSFFVFPRPLTASVLLLCSAAGLTLMGACTQLSEVACLSDDECNGQICLAGRCVDPADASDSGPVGDTTDAQGDGDAAELPDGDTDDTDASPDADVSPDGSDIGDTGDTGILNACGGTEELPGTLGAQCGACAQGQLACVPGDNNALNCVGDTELNACGGCAELAVVPGTGCRAETEEGTWICNGPDAAVCIAGAGLNVCGGTEPLANEPGENCGECSIWLCGTGRELSCVADERSADCRPDDTCASLNCAGQNRQCIDPESGDAVCGACVDGHAEVSGLCIPEGSSCDDDADCPNVPGEWLACEWSDDCVERGSRSRPIQVGSCFNSECVYAAASESEDCSRDTDGREVGAPSPIGVCEVADECSAVGTQQWATARCSNGRPVDATEDRACSSPSPPEAPNIRTIRVDVITETSVVLFAQLDTLGQPATTEVGFILTEVGDSGSSPRIDFVTVPALRTEFRVSVDSLDPGTAYTIAAAAEWECTEIVTGDTLEFVTLPEAPQNFDATDGTTTDCIELRWDAVAGATGYEVSIGAGAFVSVGNVTSYRDCDARPGTIALERPVASDGTSRTEVGLSISNPIVSQPAPQNYRVRAVNASGPGQATDPESGRLSVGTPQFQWQRTSGSAETGFADIPGLTTRNTADTTGPGGGARRFYRVRVTAPGAAPAVSAADVGFRDTSCSCGMLQTECANEQGNCNSSTGCCATLSIGCAALSQDPC